MTKTKTKTSTKTEKKPYVSTAITIRRIRKGWRSGKTNRIFFMCVNRGETIRVSVGEKRVTAWFQTWDANDGLAALRPKTRKIHLNKVFSWLYDNQAEKFSLYCNSKVLSRCDPMDVAFYVLVMERILTIDQQAKLITTSNVRSLEEIQERADYVAQVTAAVASLRKAEPAQSSEFEQRREDRANVLQAEQTVEELAGVVTEEGGEKDVQGKISMEEKETQPATQEAAATPSETSPEHQGDPKPKAAKEDENREDLVRKSIKERDFSDVVRRMRYRT